MQGGRRASGDAAGRGFPALPSLRCFGGSGKSRFSTGGSVHRDLKGRASPSGSKGRAPSGEIGGKAKWGIARTEPEVNSYFCGRTFMD